MAIIPHLIRAVSSTGHYSTSHASNSRPYSSVHHYYHTVNYGAISAGVIIGVVALVFLAALIYLYYKANKENKATGKPIPHGKIILKSLACATILGLIFVIYSAMTSNTSSGPAQGMTQNSQEQTPFVNPQQQFQPEFQTQYQPQMNWTPVNAAAESQIQG